MSNQPDQAAVRGTPDDVFDALGEGTRRRIVELLSNGPAPVGLLAERLPVGRPAVSRHLKVLSDAGLVEHQARGTRHLYALAPGGLAVAQQWLVRSWDVILSAFAAEVERQEANHEQATTVRKVVGGAR